MTSPDDLIEYPAQPGEYGRRALIEALIAADSPPTNSLTRLYAEQKQAWIAYQNKTGAPADNPDDESQALAHVRGVAADIDESPDTVRRLEAAGLVRPYSYEPWHWQLPGDPRRFALIRTKPTFNPKREDDDMGTYVSADKEKTVYWWNATTSRIRKLTASERAVVIGGRALAPNKIAKVGTGWLAQAIALGK